MKCIAFSFTGSSTLSWLADQDYVVTQTASSGTAFAGVLSADPSMTVAQLQTPSANKLILDVIGYIGSNARSNSQLDFLVLKGTTLFVNVGGSQTVFVWLRPVSAEV